MDQEVINVTDSRTYSSAFQRAFTALILDEGPETNDPKDPGGRTKFGISARLWPNIDLDTLTIDDAREFYYTNYWNAVHGDSFKEGIGELMFDCAVNQGISACVRIAQRAMHITDDGIIGLGTRTALEQYSRTTFIERFTAMRIFYYKGTKNFDYYGLGWISRAIRAAIRVSR
jgi:lysozyme family protein